MAANEYLKTAAAHLHRAAIYLQQQARGLVAERDRAKSQKTNEISKHQLDVKMKQVEIVARTNTAEKAVLAREVHNLQKQIVGKKQEVQQIDHELSDAARLKQVAAEEVITKARDLERRAGSPELTT